MKRRTFAGCLALFMTLLPVWLIPATAAQPGQTPALPVAEIGTRPRLLIPRRYLQDTLQPRIEDNVSSWQAFKAYVDGTALLDDLILHPEAVIHALGLAWLLTSDTRYYDRAILATQYLINAIEDTPAMRQPSQWQHDGLQQLAALAVAYDWFYTLFRPDDRRIIADVLLRAASRLQNPRTAGERIWVADIALDPTGSPDTYWFAAFNSESALWLWALTATVLALQGEYPEVSLMIDRVRNLWTGFILPALALQPNGAWAGGPVDGFTAGWWLSQTALAWWTARGENYFDDTDWWVQRPAYNTLMHYPMAQPASEPTTAVLGYPNIIGDGARNDTSAAYGHAQDLLLAAVLPDTPYAPWVNWIAQQIQLPPWLQVETLLWHDPYAGGGAPDVLSWRAFGTNHVFLRSHWIDAAGWLDPNTTVVTLQAGDHFAPRQFFDQGNFTIWRGGVELVTRGGVYSGRGDSHHDANYYARTIGGNTILICDLAEIFDGIRPDREAGFWLNDCGQRAVGPGSYAAINHQFVLANRRLYDTANITRIFDSAVLTYIQSDLTAAYNSLLYTTPGNQAKVELVEREFVYIRPGAVVVYDRVRTLSPDFTTLDSFHFSARPQFDGTTWILRDGNSILYFQQLVPDGFTQIVDGYITAGQLVASAPGQQRAGWNRLDIFPPAPTTTPWFLHTFVVTDAAAAPPLPALLVVGESMRGVVVSTPLTRWQVMFDDDPQNVTQASFSIEAGIQALFLTGLAPAGPYLLHWANGLTERRTTDGAGTLLLQNPVPSLFELELAD